VADCWNDGFCESESIVDISLLPIKICRDLTNGELKVNEFNIRNDIIAKRNLKGDKGAFSLIFSVENPKLYFRLSFSLISNTNTILTDIHFTTFN
jgi:hypothetical protein